MHEFHGSNVPEGARVSDEPGILVDVDEAAAQALADDWKSGTITPREYAERWSRVFGGKEAREEDGRTIGYLARFPEGELTFDFDNWPWTLPTVVS